MSQNQLFMKYNALTGKTFDQEDPDAGSYYFDAQGKARVRFSYRGDKKFYEFRPTPTSHWQDLDDAVKQPGLKFNEKGGDALDSVVAVHSVSPDGDTLYISTRLGSDTFQLAAFSMSKGVIFKTVAKHPKYDLTIRDGGASRLLFAKRSTQLLGMVFEAQKPRVIWIEPRFVAMQKSIDTTFPENVNIPVDWSTDGSTLIFFSYSDKDPGTYYLLQTKTGELVPLMQLNERLQGKTLGQTTPIEITARDGQLIPGYVTLPPEVGADASGKLPPLLVIVHGGPMARDGWRFDPMNQFFATRGYVVLQVNYRGSSGYGAAFQAAGLRARLDTVVLDDIADGVHELIKKHQVDPNKIAVAGASFGGWATYMCLAKYPELFRTGVAISAVTSWQKTLKDRKWSFNDKYAYAFWYSLLERQDYSANAKYIDPLLRVAEIKQPVFIIHGARDDVVSTAEADLMLAALKKQGTPVEVKSFPEATHSYWPFADRVEMLNEIAAFLERNLPPSSGGDAKIAAH
jgi:pimeloyl-ACP methyl ester carboxylesterase